MKKTTYYLLSILFFSSFSIAANEFRYIDGRCINKSGQIGLNQISQDQLEKSLDGECGDFKNSFLNLHFTTSLDRKDMINLRGAVIGSVSFQFIVVYADFSGANVTIKGFGYHTLKGISDKYSHFIYDNVLLGEREVLDLDVGTFCLSDSSGCK